LQKEIEEALGHIFGKLFSLILIDTLFDIFDIHLEQMFVQTDKLRGINVLLSFFDFVFQVL
jgi:hypothetical protein